MFMGFPGRMHQDADFGSFFGGTATFINPYQEAIGDHRRPQKAVGFAAESRTSSPDMPAFLRQEVQTAGGAPTVDGFGCNLVVGTLG